MTIGIDASRANLQNRTGTEWYSFAVITRLMTLVPSDIQVVLYVQAPLLSDWPPLPSNWRVHVLRWRPGLLWTQLRLSWHLLWHRPDVLYVPAHTIPLIHPTAVVTVIHDVGFAHADALYNNQLIGGMSITHRAVNAIVRLLSLGKYSAREQDYHRFAVQHAINSQAAIITVSNFSRDEIQTYYHVPTERITVIHNGFNPVAAANQDTTILERFNIHQPFLLSIGRLEQKKNTPRLIDAFAQLCQQTDYPGQLVLVGTPGYGYDEVQQKIMQYGLQDRVIETGWLADGDVSTLLHHAQAFIFPSLYEGFGIPILEAMSAGVPVVCSDIPPLREVAGEAAEWFDPTDTNSMVQALERITQQADLRSQFITKGQERVTHFSWDRTAEQTWEVLKKFL